MTTIKQLECRTTFSLQYYVVYISDVPHGSIATNNLDSSLYELYFIHTEGAHMRNLLSQINYQ